MACRSCNSALGALSRRPTPSLRQTCPSLLPAQIIAANTTCARRLQSTAAPGSPIPSSPSDPPARDKLQELRRQAASAVARRGGVGAAYAVYGNTERLTRLLASQADYTISAADRKAGTVQTTSEGEEVGAALPIPLPTTAPTQGGREKGEQKQSIWHVEFGLPPTFSTWAHVSMLHLYLIVARLRACDDMAIYKSWQAQMVDHFFHEAERRIVETHGIASGMLRQRYLKDLFVQWRGLLLAYDEGLAKGDAVLASAVWRNLFKARGDVDVRVLAGVVGFMRRCLREWDRVGDGEFLEALHDMGGGRGADWFAKMAREEWAMVDVPVAGMKGLEVDGR